MTLDQIDNGTKNYIKLLFSEDSGVSMMRVCTFLCVIVSSSLAFLGMIMGKDLASTAVLCGSFLSAGMIGKTIQKFAENKQ